MSHATKKGPGKSSKDAGWTPCRNNKAGTKIGREAFNGQCSLKHKHGMLNPSDFKD